MRNTEYPRHGVRRTGLSRRGYEPPDGNGFDAGQVMDVEERNNRASSAWEDNMKVTLAVSIAAMAALAVPALAQDKPQLAFVVNAASDFWKLAEAGVAKAQTELPGYELQFRYPSQGTAALQNALMDDLVAAGTDAIMISSADPKNSIDAFNRIAAQVPLFTTDSDAPESDRIAYLGSSNTLAGVQAGEIAVKALPDGGKCMGFVGFLGADNAIERIAGFRQAVEGTGIELVDVRGDDVDFARARSNVDDVLAANPDITCMVGFDSMADTMDCSGSPARAKAAPPYGSRSKVLPPIETVGMDFVTSG